MYAQVCKNVQMSENHPQFLLNATKKSCIRETPTLSTDADGRTNTNLKRMQSLLLLLLLLLLIFF